MTKRLAGLQQRGLIKREPDPVDGRSSTVWLIREGSRLVETTLREHVANQRRLLSGLEREDRAELARLLEKLAISLGDQAERRVAR